MPFPSPGDLPNPEIEPGSPALQADALPSEPPGKQVLANKSKCQPHSRPQTGPCAHFPGAWAACSLHVAPTSTPAAPLLPGPCIVQDSSSSNQESMCPPGPFFCASCTRKQNDCPAALRKPTVEIASESPCSVAMKAGLLGNNPFQMENRPFVKPEINSCHITLRPQTVPSTLKRGGFTNYREPKMSFLALKGTGTLTSGR